MDRDTKSPKERFRRKCMERLKRIGRQSTFQKDRAVLKRLQQVIEEEGARSVMLYLPLGTEVDISPLIRYLRRHGITVYVPFMEGASFRLVKYRYPLRVKRFGIKEPNDSKQYRNRQIDIAVVPIVGMDATYRRVGFGKGMYDRFFEKEIKNINRVIFVARALCYSKEIVTDRYDVKADMVIVP